jgi:hypothetical protein
MICIKHLYLKNRRNDVIDSHGTLIDKHGDNYTKSCDMISLNVRVTVALLWSQRWTLCCNGQVTSLTAGRSWIGKHWMLLITNCCREWTDAKYLLCIYVFSDFDNIIVSLVSLVQRCWWSCRVCKYRDIMF